MVPTPILGASLSLSHHRDGSTMKIKMSSPHDGPRDQNGLQQLQGAGDMVVAESQPTSSMVRCFLRLIVEAAGDLYATRPATS